MSTSVSWNGSSYTVPAQGEEDWGGSSKVDGLLVSLAQNALSKAGGTFSITAEVDFGANAGCGLKAQYYKSRGTNVSTAGIIRMANAEGVYWRNAANSADIGLVVDSSDNLTYNGNIILTSGGVLDADSGGTGQSSYAVGDTLYASGTTALSKLTIGSANKVLTSTGTAPAWNLLVNANIDAAAAIAYSKLNLALGIVNADISASAAIAYSKLSLTGSIISGDLAGNVAVNKLAALTASRAIVSDGSGFISVSSVTSTEVGRLSGIGSSAVGISDSQVLTNKDIDGGTASNTSRLTLPKASLSTITALTRKQATLIYASDVNKVYKDDGSSLTEIGSASGAINYISNPDAEGGTTGWATYKDTAQSTPVDGTGGSPTLTFTASSTTPLRGTQSFLITTTAANLQGEGASYDFSISRADQAKVLSISFDYNIASGTYADGDITVYIYDVTNSLLIQPAAYSVSNLGSSSLYGKFISTFQTASNSTSYRLIFHRAVSTSSAMTMKIDNVVLGPQIVQYGAPVTDWTSYTPTGSWVSNSTYTGQWRRVGDSMEVKVRIALAGAPTSATLTVNLPSGYTIDTAKLAASTNTQALGYGFATDSGVSSAPVHVDYSSTTALLVRYETSSSPTILANVTQAAPYTFGNLDSVEFKSMVPIVGWSSTVQMSNDTDTRVCAAVATFSGSQTLTSGAADAIIAYANIVNDTHGAFTTGASAKFTAPISGYYEIEHQLYLDSGTWAAAGNRLKVTLYKNGSALKTFGRYNAQAAVTTDSYASGVTTIFLNAADTIDIRATQNSGASKTVSNDTAENYISIKRVSGPSAIAASEKIYLQYSQNASTVLTANTTNIDWSTKVVDSHGAWSGTTFTSPRSGLYIFVANCSFSSSSARSFQLYVNGSGTITSRGMASGTDDSISFTRYLNAGDTATIRCEQSGTLSNSSSTHWISIFSQG